MRMPTRPLVALIALALTLGAGPAVLAADERFRSPGKQSLAQRHEDPRSARVTFSARWSRATSVPMRTRFDGATLRVIGGPGEGDSGLIHARAGNWKALPKGKGFRYLDKTRSAGGVEPIQLRNGQEGRRRLKIVGGERQLDVRGGDAPERRHGDAHHRRARSWCAQFSAPKTKKTARDGQAPQPLDACPCETFDSTWEAIQTLDLRAPRLHRPALPRQRRGRRRAGGLNLSPDVAYENLVNVYSEQREAAASSPARAQDSFLWQKLAATTLGLDLGDDAGTPMPRGLPAITPDELEAIRLWIQFGAPKDGVVAGTEALLDACLPPAEAAARSSRPRRRRRARACSSTRRRGRSRRNRGERRGRGLLLRPTTT